MNGSSRLAVATIAIAIVLSTALAIFPLLGVTYPPLNDLPNHLARIAVLRAPAGSPLLDYYQVHWAIVPNLATDLLLLAASTIMPLALAAKLLVALLAIAWILAPFLLHCAVYRRISVTPLIGAAFVFNQALAMGFVNFVFGSIAFVLGFAVWILLAARPFGLRLAAAAALSTLLFFCHLFVAAMFVIALLIWEFVPSRRADNSLLKRLGYLVMAILPVALGTLLTPRVADPLTTGWPDALGLVVDAILDLTAFLQAGNFWSSLAFLALAVAVVVALFRRAEPRLGLVCLVMFVLFAILPFDLLGGAHVDWRMLAPLCLLVAAWLPFRLERHWGIAWSVIILAFLAVQTLAIDDVWQRNEANYRDFEAALQPVPPGARLYYAKLPPAGGPRAAWLGVSVHHLGSYATVERGVVVPSLFAKPSQQPIIVRPEYTARHQALASAEAESIGAIDWPLVAQDFDYAMLAHGTTAPPGFELLGSAGIFSLFKPTR